MRYLIICFIAFFLPVLTAGPAFGQIQRAPVDTGKLEWGHQDPKSYVYPTMCDRAGFEFVRKYSRKYIPDTTETEKAESYTSPYRLPEEGRAFVEKCLTRYSADEVALDQMWGYIRSALLLGDDLKVDMGIRRLVEEVDSLSQKQQIYSQVVGYTLQVHRFDLLAKYLSLLDDLTDYPSSSSISVRNEIASFWLTQYVKDSIIKYANEAIAMVKSADPEELDKTSPLMPYRTLIQLANDDGDLAGQQMWLDSLNVHTAKGLAGRHISFSEGMQRLIDSRKQIYGRRANAMHEGLWFNSDDKVWPHSNRVSLIVWINHLCMEPKCLSQYRTIRNIERLFGGELHVTLATSSSGWSHGTFVLSQQEEGDSIAKLFSYTFDMPYAILLDPRPSSKLPDGRVIRGMGPIAELFSDWEGMNAILTDRNGRVQWIGNFTDISQRRAMISIINRIISIDN